MTKDEESRLIAKAQRGDEAAFEQLVRSQQKAVYNLALKLTGSPDDALDVSQDVFLKAWLNLSTFRGDSRLAVWLYRMTYNASMDLLKRSHVPGRLSLDMEGEDEPVMEVPDPRPLPDEEAERRELQEEVWRAVNELPEDKRRVLILREFSGLSYAQIAERLDVEEGTVKSRLSRARLTLAEVFRKSGTFEKLGQSKGQNQTKGGREA